MADLQAALEESASAVTPHLILLNNGYSRQLLDHHIGRDRWSLVLSSRDVKKTAQEVFDLVQDQKERRAS